MVLILYLVISMVYVFILPQKEVVIEAEPVLILLVFCLLFLFFIIIFFNTMIGHIFILLIAFL